MQITPISIQNNPNFQALSVSRRTLKSLGCSRDDILKNESVKDISNKTDVYINSLNGSIFKKATDFMLIIKKPSDDYHSPFNYLSPFKTMDELSEQIHDYYFRQAKKEYPVEYYAFKSIEKEVDVLSFIKQMDYLMLSIARIPNTPQYKKLNEYFLSVLQKMRFWKPLSNENNNIPNVNKDYWEKANIDTTESAGLLALKNNHLELLKFLKEKGENLNQCLDYIKTNPVSDEAKEILKDVKYQDSKIFQIKDLISSPSRLQKFLDNNPNIDINSRNAQGDTLAIEAIKRKNIKLINYLLTRDDVDWNAYDKNAQNILMYAVLNPDDKVISALLKIPEGKLDLKKGSVMGNDFSLNYNLPTHYSRIMNPMSHIIRRPSAILLKLFNLKNFDVMDSYEQNERPLAFEAVLIGAPTSVVDKIFKHKSIDIHQKVVGESSLFEQVCLQRTAYDWIYNTFMENLPNIIANETIKLYDINGELTLEQINTYLDAMLDNKLDYNSFKKQPSFNSIGDNIGHLLCDTYVKVDDKEKMKELENVIIKLRIYDYDFSQKNGIGQTPLSRAIEGENYGLIKVLIKMYKRKSLYGTQF